MSRPSYPSRTNRIHHATNRVSLPGFNRTGRARWNVEAPTKRGEYYVTVGHVDKPYGRSTHNSAYLTHVTRGVLLVWRKGQYLGAMCIWRCGARSTTFELLDEPNSPICPVCKIERLGLREKNV